MRPCEGEPQEVPWASSPRWYSEGVPGCWVGPVLALFLNHLVLSPTFKKLKISHRNSDYLVSFKKLEVLTVPRPVFPRYQQAALMSTDPHLAHLSHVTLSAAALEPPGSEVLSLPTVPLLWGLCSPAP